MANFNTASPNTQGIEWNPVSEPGVTLNSLTAIAAMSIEQSSAGTIGTNRVWLRSLPTRGGIYAIEVYDGETCVPANVVTADFMPNEDVAGFAAGDWTGVSVNSAGNRYTNIDEVVLDLNDYITATAPEVTRASIRVATGTGTLTGKRILNVAVVCDVGSSSATASANPDVALNISGTDYKPTGAGVTVLGTNSGPGTSDQQIVNYPYNPTTLRPWTAAEVAAFDTGDEITFGASQINFGGGGTGDPRVYRVAMRVTYADENRIAVGVLNDTGSALTANAWNAASMFTPAGVANYTKDASGRHLFTIRRISGTGSIVVGQLAASTWPTPARGFAPTIDPTSYYATAMGDPTPNVFGLIQRTTAPAEHADSQPYVDLAAAVASTGVTVQQEITAASTGDRNGYRVQVRPVHAVNTVADLLVKVKRRSDNVQMGSTVTLTKAAVDALADAGSGWKLPEGIITPTAAPLVNTVQYYLEFSSVAASAAVGWEVAYLDTGDQGNGAGYGGTTDRGTPGSIAEADRYDVLGNLLILPTPPANFATSLTNQALPDDGTDCAVTAFSHPHLAWTATGLGGSFLHYEIDRSIAGGDFERVAEIATEAQASWDDYEAPRGLQSCYRIRAIRSDGAASAWSATDCETPAASCAEWAFVSNADPTLNIAFAQNGSEVEYAFLDASDVDYFEMYRRNYQVAIAGTESRGVSFEVPVIVRGPKVTSGGGVAVYDRIRALQEADVPYICVLDSMGNRFFADVRVPSGPADTAVDLYLATIKVVEVRDSAVVDAA